MITEAPGRRARVEQAITGIAARQHGVVTRAQLLGAGLSSDTVYRLVEAKRLRPLHRGVYLVGPLPQPKTHVFAAVVACGKAAVVSHGSAAALWRWTAQPEGSKPVDVTVPGGDRRRPGIRVHRPDTLRRDEVTKLDGIPVTTPARTLLDLAAVMSGRDLERVVAQAIGTRLVRPAQLIRLLERHARRPGASRLRALLDARPPVTRSEAEKRFLELIRKAQLPKPEVNVDVAGHEVDFYWPDAQLVVEMDGFAYHSSADAFESDRRRDTELYAAGVHVSRVTWQQLVEEPEAVLVLLTIPLAHALRGEALLAKRKRLRRHPLQGRARGNANH